MSRSGDGPAVVLLTASGPDETERARQRLAAAGLRVVVAGTADEAARAAGELGAPPPPGEIAQMVVHHLKGPLTGLFATLEMLADGDMGRLTERQARAVDELRTRGEEMLELVEDLLQLWRVEDGMVDVSPAPVSPEALLRRVRAEWDAAFARAGSRLVSEADASLPPLRADEEVLRRCLGNLLHNALQHAGRGITVRLAARADQSQVRLSVYDDGVGIPPEHREAVFRRFARVPRPDGGASRGTGLGLAYCRLAAIAHGGTIWVESAGERGTVFHVRIPAMSGGTDGVA